MVALGVLTGFCLIMAQGCIKPIIKPEIGTQIAISLSAKALGQKLQRNFEWTPQMDQFVKLIESDGLSVTSAQILSGYVDSQIPKLYQSEARLILEGIGVEFNGSEVIGATKIDKDLLLLAISAFKEGLFFYR